MITIKSDREILLMRAAGKLAAKCLRDMGALVKEGNTPLQIDRACREWTAKHDAIPAPLNYKGTYPASLCVSVNDVVCHGIPDNRPFKKGDIVNLDVTPILNGYHGDTNATFFVGDVPENVRKFVSTAYLGMWAGIRQVRPGNTLGDIGYAIETLVKARGYSVVLEYCGHGIGRNFHEDPVVMHVGRPKQGIIMKPGMTFTIEPMINMGGAKTTSDDDGWTARTADGSLSAQFEHTVLVTPDGVEVLTLGEGENPPPAPAV
ncbi:MAG: type I methionyl aminopeptidase [Bdellovibrionota bacterium]